MKCYYKTANVKITKTF